ncbi:MAG: hypothetical protein RXR06_07950 [Thermoproteus sp.]
MDLQQNRQISDISIEGCKQSSITIRTQELEFSCSYYEEDNRVAVFLGKKLNNEHGRIVYAYVDPDDLKKLIDAFDQIGGEEVSGLDAVVANNAGAALTRINVNGITVAFGHDADKYRVFAEAVWKNEDEKIVCYAREYDADTQNIENLKHYVQNVLSLVERCVSFRDMQKNLTNE